ncbi:carbohydrate ABC transporter permease [Geosporobacter ferrireducens]|uniref:Sugar ABC transporter permease n=1 Tax=Geosporobacter ferrireducens TaxID=1424294 RepID=A0A1D8GEH1_9FIRM|nr:carbohydrate ABC transporter permease [Geosporobacter ferrireducens]AOT69312.1 sugar ABC transporter permease [Geosporobacter ferrireducens]MTI56997.1 carbohydrate ABC transporter permease [Geosporobacter ferrireducens]
MAFDLATKRELPRPFKTNTRRKNASTIILYFLLILLAILCFLPFYMMMINSTHTSNDIATQLNILPGNAFTNNYRRMMESVNMWQGFKNSLIISVSSTALAAYFGALTAYGFSKYKFKGSKVLFGILLGSMMFPSQLGLIGFFKVCSELNLINKHLALIIPAIANANFAFFVKLYIDAAVPNEIVESARIDGCGEFKIFNKIVIPIITPSIATMSIFTFIASWNSYLVPLVVLYDEQKYTVPILTAMAKGVYRTDFGAVYVAIAMSMVPIMIVFAFCSKYIIGGLTAGAVKQ